MLIKMDIKYCPRCDTIKSTYSFAKNKTTLDGLQGYCKTCMGEYRKKYNKNTPRYLDISGQTFGNVHVLEYAGIIKHRAVFKIHCDMCGGDKIMTGKKIRRSYKYFGEYANCGCRKERMHTQEEHYQSALKSLYRIYKSSAKDRDLEFELSIDDFEDIVTQTKCVYCGDQITRIHKSRSTYNPQGFIFAGIDRVDNTKGYIEGNVLACCQACNQFKMSQSLEEFVGRIKKIAERAAMILDGYK